MNQGAWPPERVPTLTEVVDLGGAPTAPAPLAPAIEADVVSPGAPFPAPVQSSLTEEQLVQRVLADVQRQVDLMLEYRLRELLGPIMTRATDSVVREARTGLASTLRDIVARAVTQEIGRRR